MSDRNSIDQLQKIRDLLPELAHKLRGEQPGVKSELEQLYQLLLDLLIGEDGMYFSTGFAALSYLGVKYKLDGKLLFRLHAFRKQLDSDRPSEEPAPWRSGFHSMATLVYNLTNSALPNDFEEFYVADEQMQSKSGEISDYLPWEKVLFTGKKTEDGWEVLREETGGEKIFIQLDRAEVFDVGMRELQEMGAANINLLLKEIQVDPGGVWHPAIVLIEPDFIMDVTAVASCIQPDGNFPSIHLLKKFLPPKTTKYILGGHVANYFLDRLMANPSLKYETLMAEAFFIDPIAFCTLSNEEVQYIASQARNYYRHLSRLIRENFLARGKDLNDFSIEPSFYSPQNGLQGRLDLLYRDPENRRIEIFELKSGSAFRPNAYKINPSHYAQTMLYYLIIKDLYSTGPNLSAYIIYAKDGGNTLRYAPAVKPFQQQTLAVRNQLLIRELKMQQFDKAPPEEWINYTGLGLLKDLKGFTGDDAKGVLAKWEQLDRLEKSYFQYFYAFVSREYRNSKINHRPKEERSSGLSSLWLDSQKNKEERFALYTRLKVTEDCSTEENPLLTFSRENCPQTLANFRMGDVVVLYTTGNEGNGTPFTQVYRGTLVELDGPSLTVRLRSKLSESDRPPRGVEWVLEPDVLESGFHHYFRSLALFLHAPGEKRKLWMGRRAPCKGELKPFEALPILTEEQNRVIQKIISSEDYFLLWGPPGTGKTSMVIKELIRHLVGGEGERVLLLAYTNRAVDEICDAVKSLSTEFEENSIRIGSRYGVHPDHHDLLLDRQISTLNTRREVYQLLTEKKIFVSTISSFYGKIDLLKLVRFDTVVIDEASQILEPNLVGLLSKFNRTVLIGDHCQLPAIVTQHPGECSVKDEKLKSIGLHDLSDSLFERLFRIAVENRWEHAFDRLTQQGRMHRQINDFVSLRFYGGKLSCLDADVPGAQRLHQSLSNYYPAADEGNFNSPLSSGRIQFIDHPAAGLPVKTNAWEAHTVLELSKAYFQARTREANTPLDRLVGVICPYRAQIALIKSILEEKLPEFYEYITVDTVERYQGGARDVVFLSLCTNHPSQLRTLVNANRTGLDRKLNVALTRAREQIIVLGNREILSKNETYKDLIEKTTVEKSFSTDPSPLS